jgi:AcrR family transcriptional regulator
VVIIIPPKQRFNREQIIRAALNLVRRGGLAELTARNLGTELGCSSQPIFTEFQNMEEVQREMTAEAKKLYHGYVFGKGPACSAFRRIDYIRFAKEEPELFSLLFMTAKESEYALADILSGVFSNADGLVVSVQVKYSLSREDAHTLCSSMWLFIHGVACLCATGMTQFIEAEVEALVNSTFDSILSKFNKLE